MLVFDQLASTVVFYDGLGDKVVAHDFALPTLFTASLRSVEGDWIQTYVQRSRRHASS
jgi:hypothetical protein